MHKRHSKSLSGFVSVHTPHTLIFSGLVAVYETISSMVQARITRVLEADIEFTSQNSSFLK